MTQISSLSPKDRSSKKRKLSETDADISSPQQSTNKLKDKTNVTPSNKKSASKPASKKTPGKSRAVKVPDPSQPEVEIEVSSSSEDTVAAASAAKSPSKKKPKPLDRFLQASQEPTSTSDEEVIDLAASGGQKAQKDEEAGKSESKDEQSSSSDAKEVTLVDDSNDGCKEANGSLASDDEGSAGDDSVLDSSTASEASCNTSIDEKEASPSVVKDKDSKPADSASEVSSISSTPKSAPKPKKVMSPLIV